MRLDVALVEWGLVASRARAKDLIGRGCVHLRGEALTKPNKRVTEHERQQLTVDDFVWVSRSALKLSEALEHFDPDNHLVPDRHCLDIGASTGGFTDVLLDRGARHVTALDVGHGQLHEKLRHDPRVLNLEGINVRHLQAGTLPYRHEIVVSDVSFISLKIALPSVMAIAPDGAHLFALIKPQFEIGHGQLGKGGIVRDATVRDAVVLELVDWFAARPGWRVNGYVDSALAGPDGNREAIVYATKGTA